MALNKIILEAPKFGAGRTCKKRPIDLTLLLELTDGDSVKEAYILRTFAAQLREALCKIATLPTPDRVELAKLISDKAEEMGAHELAEAAQKVKSAPDDAGSLMKFTKSVVATSTFLASLNRV